MYSRVVHVVPRPRLAVEFLPRQIAADHRSLHEFVKVKRVLKARVVLHDNSDIVDRRRRVPRFLIHFKLRYPIHVRRFVAFSEELDDIIKLLALQLLHHVGAVGLYPLYHVLERGQIVGSGIRRLAFVVLAE